MNRTGTWLTDSSGRVVVMHGFNIMRKLAPFYAPITDADASFLSDEGFTWARLGIIWEAAEPKPGKYDDTYIRRVLADGALLEKHGVHSLLDFHQDEWSRFSGGDGAPQWATTSSNSLVDWQHFWDDAPGAGGVGIQTRFIKLWAHVAAMLKRSPSGVIALNPINEPSPGSESGCSPVTFCPVWAAGPLAHFYDRMITAVRSAGLKQIVMPEANPLHSNPDLPVDAIGLPAPQDRQTAYNFHSYCLLTETGAFGDSAPVASVCSPSDEQSVSDYLSHAKATHQAVVCTEFSANDDHLDNEKMISLLDSAFVSWTSWAYTYYPGDPASGVKDGLFVDPAKGPVDSNLKVQKVNDFAVPYARAIAGTPTSYSYDRAHEVLTVGYSTRLASGANAPDSLPTEIFLPRRHYAKGYTVSVSGGRVTSSRGARLLTVTALPRATSVTVTVKPK